MNEKINAVTKSPTKIARRCVEVVVSSPPDISIPLNRF
jgi:hypothetical protein